jgi:hypothetical protein
VHLDPVEHVSAEIQCGGGAAVAQRGAHVAPAVVEQQALPAVHRVGVQVQTGVGVEVRCTEQLAIEAVGPAVDRADDVLARLAAPAQHQRLTVAADVRHQPNALVVADQGAALAFMCQRVVVARFADPQLVAGIARPGLEDQCAFVAEHALVEIASCGKLSAAALKSCETDAQVRHDPEDLHEWVCQPPTRWPRGWV